MNNIFREISYVFQKIDKDINFYLTEYRCNSSRDGNLHLIAKNKSLRNKGHHTIKNCKESLAKPIHLLWSRSMEKSDVPDFYKFSHVFPLHKKDSRAFAANYRPISLTSHVVKVFERVLRKKMVDYLELNDLICSKQHGFRSGRSCLTQLLHHFDDVLEALTQNSDFDSIYLDYAKAFDKVDHKLLVKKLTLYGIHPKIVKWIESFLTNRTQSVVVDGTFSLLALIISGVPQGTVLGPIPPPDMENVENRRISVRTYRLLAILSCHRAILQDSLFILKTACRQQSDL